MSLCFSTRRLSVVSVYHHRRLTRILVYSIDSIRLIIDPVSNVLGVSSRCCWRCRTVASVVLRFGESGVPHSRRTINLRSIGWASAMSIPLGKGRVTRALQRRPWVTSSCLIGVIVREMWRVWRMLY
jgi:hypothetical protein